MDIADLHLPLSFPLQGVLFIVGLHSDAPRIVSTQVSDARAVAFQEFDSSLSAAGPDLYQHLASLLAFYDTGACRLECQLNMHHVPAPFMDISEMFRRSGSTAVKRKSEMQQWTRVLRLWSWQEGASGKHDLDLDMFGKVACMSCMFMCYMRLLEGPAQGKALHKDRFAVAPNSVHEGRRAMAPKFDVSTDIC